MNRPVKKSYITVPALYCGLILLLSLFFLLPKQLNATQEPPRAQKGILDLTDWDFSRDGTLKINGEWEFYWKKLLTPEDFKKKKIEKTGFMNIPRVWNGYKINGKELKGQGYATFRLTIKLKEAEKIYACSIHRQETAYRMWIDDRMFLSNGKVGRDRNSMLPEYRATTGTFTPEHKTVQVVIQVSNFFHKKGGIRNGIYLGIESDIRQSRDMLRTFDAFTFGSLLIMAMYHLALYWLRREDTSPLYFGTWCLFFALRILFDGTYLLEFYPGANWGIVYKLYYIFGYVSLPLFASFIHMLYPREFSRKILRMIQVAGTVYLLFVLFTPAIIYTHSAISYQTIIFVSMIYVLYVLIRAALRKREGAGIFIGGFIVLFTSIVLFLLDDNGIIDTHDFLPFGVFVFIFAQSLILSMRFSSAFTLTEIQAGQLQEVRNYLNNVINSMPSIIIGLDREGRVTHWNNEAEKATGTGETGALGKALQEVFPSLDERIIRLSKHFKETEPVTIEKVKSQNEGETVYQNVVMYPLAHAGAEGVVLRIDDITELEKKESQLRQSQKMETVGTLAGGLAHDFNNVLAGIFGTISILQHKMKKYHDIDPDELKNYLTVMENSSVRAKEMVQQLLSLSRKQELNLSPADCNLIMENIMKICDSAIDKSVNIHTHYAPEPAMVYADAAQIEQALLNLCINASHAMTVMKKEGARWGGSLTVAVDNIYADRHFCSSHPEAESGYYWMISVRDTGVGMDSTTLSKIFTPFYTTKEKESGTGLGLAMVYSIIRQHNGFIDVYSEPGVGSVFSFYLPVYSGEAGETETDDGHEVPLAPNKDRILIVDDEEIMRITSKDILEECGYRVAVARGGYEALDIFKEKHAEISAVLLDMVMPDMQGGEVYLKMREIDPGVRVLLSSGFRQDERVEKALALGIRGFIQKPYSLRKLAEAMYAVVTDETIP